MTEETEAAEASETTVTAETSASEAVAETSQTQQVQAVETAVTAPSDDINSSNINEQKLNVPLLLIVGVIAVAAAYTGLFFLGRRNGRKQ